MTNKQRQSQSGFTLVETLVAVTILMIGVIGPLSLAARGISDGLFAQNQLTANLLAQEAMETIINKRNSNVTNILNIVGNDPFFSIWDDNEAGGANHIDTVNIDPVSSLVTFNCPTTGCYLNLDTDGLYVPDTSPSASGLFRRQITVAKSGVPDELKVTVKIDWRNKTIPKTFTITEYLYAK